MPQVDIGGCLSYGVDRFKANMGFHVLATLVIMFVGGLSCGLVSGCLMVGYIRALKKEDEGGVAEVGDLFAAFDTFLPSIILLLLMVVASFIPFGGLIASPIYFVGLYLVAQGEKDGVEAIKRAFALCQPVFVMAIVANLAFSLVGSLGILLCCVGIVATLPIAIIANYRLAQTIVGGGGDPQLQQPAAF